MWLAPGSPKESYLTLNNRVSICLSRADEQEGERNEGEGKEEEGEGNEEEGEGEGKEEECAGREEGGR